MYIAYIIVCYILKLVARSTALRAIPAARDSSTQIPRQWHKSVRTRDSYACLRPYARTSICSRTDVRLMCLYDTGVCVCMYVCIYIYIYIYILMY